MKNLQTHLRNILTCVLVLLGGIALSQPIPPGSTEKFNKAILDSAVRYELIKPALAHLQTAYEQQGKQVSDLQNIVRLSAMQNELQRKDFATQIAEERKRTKKRFWVGIKIGSGVGLIIALITIF